MRALLLFLLPLGLVGLGILSLIPLLWRWVPQSVALVPAAPQFAAAAMILALTFLLLKARKAAVLALGLALWNGALFWPGLGDLSGSTEAQAGSAPALKVVAFNLWYRNADPAATLRYLAQSDADVIGLVEATPRLKAALAPLQQLYPHRVDCIDVDPDCEIMLLSKHPLQNAYAGRIDGRYPYVAEAAIIRDGRSVTVAVTHLSWPFLAPAEPEPGATMPAPAQPELADVPRLSQSLQAANLARHVNRLPRDLVLMGDFNSASWSAVQQAFRAATGLENRGRYLPSWPSWNWSILRLPIDHVFTRGGVRVTQMRLGPAVGSDHLPVEAEVAVVP